MSADSLLKDTKGKERVTYGPPRPNAIATIMTSDEALVATQTLLYSIKANLPKISNNSLENISPYQPEILSLVSSKVSKSARDDLRCFCHKVIQVNDCTFDGTAATATATTTTDTYPYGADDIVKVNLFNQHVYQKILYIDSHCLVQKDVSHLIRNDSVHFGINNAMRQCEQIGLITAAVLPCNSDQADADADASDCFDSSIMVIQPSKALYTDMVKKLAEGTYFENAKTFLNSFFYNTWSRLPQEKRLGMKYNYLIHDNSCSYGDKKDMSRTQDVVIYSKNIGLVNSSNQMYQKWYKKSQLHKENYREEQRMIQKANDYTQAQQAKKKQRKQQEQLQQQSKSSNANESKAKQMQKHKLVTKRYKELRKQGKDPKESMRIARSEFGMDKDDERQQSASAQVASMFGMGGMI